MIRTILTGMVMLLLGACSKKELVMPGVASLMIFHAAPETNQLVTNFSTTPPAIFSTGNRLGYGSFFGSTNNIFNCIPGETNLALYLIPDTLPKSDPLFNLQFNLQEGTIHSLFLTGIPGNLESVFIKDELLNFPKEDSAMGVRFVNLIPDNIPVTINQVSKPHGSEVAGLHYKSATAFNKYPVRMDVADYVFEFRNAGTGVLIASITANEIANNGKITPNSWLYRNFTFALIGRINGTGQFAPKVVKLTHAGF